MDTSRDTGEKIIPDPRFWSATDVLIWAVIAIQVLVGVYAFIVLPDKVPIHWGIDGRPDSYGPKWIDSFLFPLMSIGLYVLLRVLLSIGPRLGGRESAASNAQVRNVILVGFVLFMLVVQLAVTTIALGLKIDLLFVINLALSVLFIFLGNYMGKLRRNFWMGIRTPWTLTSDFVWERTHRLGGWLFVAVGLLGILFSFFPLVRVWGVVVPIVVASAFLCIYSYVCYRQHIAGQGEHLAPPFDESNSE
jgi:uncharacterized membrane protein